MAPRKSRLKQNPRPPECWHTYSLQALPPGKFIEITRRILMNPKLLVTTRAHPTLHASRSAV